MPIEAIPTAVQRRMPTFSPSSGTDSAVTINGEIARILNGPDVKAKLVPQGMDIATGSPEQLARIIREDDARPPRP